MQIGINIAPFGAAGWSLDESFQYLNDMGVGAVEIHSGGVRTDAFDIRSNMLDSPDEQARLHDLLDEYDLDMSAVACHDNPLHPDDEKADFSDELLRESIRLADQIDVNTVTCFSGLPAGGPDDDVPNWVTAPWPTEHYEAYEWQWEQTIDYWSDIASLAEDHGVDVAIEMHPNMMVYEPTSMMKLREATGDRIGANFDPSHLYWQGIDIPEAIRYLGEHDAIHHVHAKDSKLYEEQARIKGNQDPIEYTEEADRAWLFRSIGYGHGEEHWKDVATALRLVGYEGALSIEHEDSLTSFKEGLEKSVDILKRSVFDTEPTEAFWAE